MIEPHLFCDPEFILEIPVEYPQPIESNVLLQLQTELYNLLTPVVRRKIHATLGNNNNNNFNISSSSSGAAVPPPPDSIIFLEINSTPVEREIINNETETKELILLITDSRAAAELYIIGLKNPFIALPFQMRLKNRYSTSSNNNNISSKSGGKPRISPNEILRKKESLRSRMNFDEDLWTTLQKSLTQDWFHNFELKYQQQKETNSNSNSIPMRHEELHEKCVESFLHYCEKEVYYVGVLNESGEASPFLMAIGLFYKLQLTHRDLLLYFVRHPRRTIRALALFISRYTLPPEELEPFFALSLLDEVIISCGEDQQITIAMCELCEELLLQNEVCEAWPPTYHNYWIKYKIQPMIERVKEEAKRREEMRQARLREGNNNNNNNENINSNNILSKAIDVRGSGKGVGVFGFKNLKELHAYVREKERVLIPQRIMTMSSAPKIGYDIDNNIDLDNDLDNDNDNDDDDDFLIKVTVENKNEQVENMEGGLQRKPGVQNKQENKQKQSAGNNNRKRQRESVITNTRALIITEAYRTVLRLLGRTEPFDKRGEHYLSF